MATTFVMVKPGLSKYFIRPLWKLKKIQGKTISNQKPYQTVKVVMVGLATEDRDDGYSLRCNFRGRSCGRGTGR